MSYTFGVVSDELKSYGPQWKRASTHVLVKLFDNVESRIDRQFWIQNGAPDAKLLEIEPKSPTTINIRNKDNA